MATALFVVLVALACSEAAGEDYHPERTRL